MASKLGALTLIEWTDSSSMVGGTWNDLEEIGKQSTPLVCKSVGWVAAENKDCVTLVAHISGGHGGGDLCIPKSSIVKRRVLR